LIRRIAIIILGFTLFGLLFYIGLQERLVLVVEELNTGAEEIFIPADGTFQLGYTHSVLLTPVDEYFEIDEQLDLKLQKTIYESFGVGLPYEQMEEASFEIVDGKFILTLDRTFKELNMVISPIPKHTLTVNDETIYFTELFGSETLDTGSTAYDKLVESDDERLANTHRIRIYATHKKVFQIGNYKVVL